MTNLSREDYALVKGLGIDWSLFERVFVSSEMNMQKPELRFYRHVLDHIHLKPKQVILVDDDTENILAACLWDCKVFYLRKTQFPVFSSISSMLILLQEVPSF